MTEWWQKYRQLCIQQYEQQGRKTGKEKITWDDVIVT